ncbi:MAG: SMP-30/gluconolactonase/LRE family protein, partial [Chloroflexota bacterium]|nr:SMP-30/gluconolactonase/LRE family protein [Chloroflexota bacterium]
MEPRVVVDHPYRLGENPLWHPLEQRLYWTDITGQGIYRLGAPRAAGAGGGGGPGGGGALKAGGGGGRVIG